MWINRLLWLIYISLLLVLWPHTAWAFSFFESTEVGWFGVKWGIAIAWSAAFTFEAAIAALTHKLAKHIEGTPKRSSDWKKFKHRYLNMYSLGLSVAVAVSVLANLAHAVQFGTGTDLVIFNSVPLAVYSVAFGGILPGASIIFARVLSNVVETEAEEDPELLRVKETIAELRTKLRESERGRIEAEQKFDAIGELATKIFGNEKRQRILAARQRWPELPAATIATIAESSPSYVSEVLNEGSEVER